MARDFKASLRSTLNKLGFEREWYLIVLGAVIGTFTALGAIAFMWGLNTAENFSGHVQAEVPRWAMPLIPMVGALICGTLVYFGAPEARGHGVPQVMKALIQQRGIIRPRVGITKILASIATVGSGGSAGAEGPIIQIGSTAGSFFGQRLKVNPEIIQTLVGCGAAAGIASVFNAPIAGVFFVLEILLRDFSLRRFTPVVVASVFSTATTQAILGENEAIFAASEKLAGYEFSFVELPSYFALGVVCGFVAVWFSALLHKGEDFFERLKIHPIIMPVVGAFVLGLIGIGFLLLVGDIGKTEHGLPAFFGNGYETIRDLLDPAAYVRGESLGVLFAFMLLALACKMIATVFTLASGGSGGVFAPSLFLGATTGAAFGLLFESIGLIPEDGSPAAYALVGMAAVVAGSTHAPLTAILMLFELTRDVYVLLPIMLAAVVATVVAQLLDRDSIYTSKLRRQGVLVGTAKDLTVLRREHAGGCDVVPLPSEAVYPSDPLSKLVALHAFHHVPDFVVVNETGSYVGMVTGADMRTALIDREAIPLLLVAELVRDDLPTVHPDETLDVVMEKFSRHDVAGLCLVTRADATKPRGIITKTSVLKRYQLALEES